MEEEGERRLALVVLEQADEPFAELRRQAVGLQVEADAGEQLFGEVAQEGA